LVGRSRVRPDVLGIGAAGATLAFYTLGSGRAFGWDASNTVANFVATPSLLDPFRRQVSFNNHVLFSALDHVVYSLTASEEEWVLRVLPTLFGAAIVGVLCWAMARRFGALAGVVAGSVVAVNPLAVREFREVRGYSLLVLCALVSTLLLLRLAANPSPSRSLVGAYCLVAGLGVATHLYMLGVLVAHAAVVIDGRRSVKRWLRRWLGAAALGLAVSAVPVTKALATHQYRTFRPWFPLQLPYELLGAEGLAFVALAAVVIAGLSQVRRQQRVVRPACAVVVIVLIAWVLAPEGLHTRYFLWLLPVVGVLAGIAVARRPILVVLVLVAVGAEVVTGVPKLGQDQVPNRVAAALIERGQREGLRTCAIRSTATTLAAYAKGFTKITLPDQLATCDLVVAAAGSADSSLVSAAARHFPHSVVLPAQEPGRAFFRDPLPLSTAARIAG
jgi:hypothetical protein